MRIGFVVNDVATEQPEFTTTRLAMAAIARGHEAWLLGVGDFSHDPTGCVAARARTASGRHRDGTAFLADVQGDDATETRLKVDDLDVLMMRNDPSEDVTDRPWAVTSGVLFGQLARGTRRARGERSVQPRQRTEQDVLPALSRVRAAADAHLPRPGHDHGVRRRRRRASGAQAAAGLGWCAASSSCRTRSPRTSTRSSRRSRATATSSRRSTCPGADDGDVRIFVLNGEAMEQRRALRRVPADQRRRRTCGPTCTSAAKRSRSRSPTRCSSSCAWSVRSSSPTGCSSSDSTSWAPS